MPFIVSDGGVTVAKGNKIQLNILQKSDSQASLGSKVSYENDDLTYD